MIYAAPGEPFEFTTYAWATGLEGILGWRVEDNGDVIIPRTTDGVVESPANSGVYQVEADAAPNTIGSYTLIVDDGDGRFASEELIVTGTLPTGSIVPGNLSSRALCTVEDVVDLLGYREDEAESRQRTIVTAINAASVAIPRRAQRDFICVPTTQTRYQYIESSDVARGYVRVGDMKATPSEVSLLTPDRDDEFIFEDDDWWPLPDNPEQGFPYTAIKIKSTAQTLYTGWWLKVTGQFGFPIVPDDIVLAAIGISALWILNDPAKLSEFARQQGRRVRLSAMIPDEFEDTVDSYRIYRVA